MNHLKRFPLPIVAATKKCIEILRPEDLSDLARNCPGLKNFDWQTYLICSQRRIENVFKTLEFYFSFTNGWRKEWPRILDFGSWLSNFALALKIKGWNVIAAEMWLRYSPALDAQKKLLAQNAVDCIDTSMITGRPQGPAYNVVLFMSVIEHIAHSPRKVLQVLNDCLQPGGLLILDTPNIAYLANRRALAHGRSVHPLIADQFYTETPFEGHVREYTASELTWMLDQTGFEVLTTKFFSYSPMSWWQIPPLDHLSLLLHGEIPIVDQLIRMPLDPTKRELIFMVARKK